MVPVRNSEGDDGNVNIEPLFCFFLF